MANKGWSGVDGGAPIGDGQPDWALGAKAPSDDDDERWGRLHDTDQRHGENKMPWIEGKTLIRPTSAGEQFVRGGFTRLETPVGGELPPVDTYPLSGVPDGETARGGNLGVDGGGSSHDPPDTGRGGKSTFNVAAMTPPAF